MSEKERKLQRERNRERERKSNFCIFKKIDKKSQIPETLNLYTDTDSNIDTKKWWGGGPGDNVVKKYWVILKSTKSNQKYLKVPTSTQ